jgi:hypothetical protein
VEKTANLEHREENLSFPMMMSSIEPMPRGAVTRPVVNTAIGRLLYRSSPSADLLICSRFDPSRLGTPPHP